MTSTDDTHTGTVLCTVVCENCRYRVRSTSAVQMLRQHSTKSVPTVNRYTRPDSTRENARKNENSNESRESHNCIRYPTVCDYAAHWHCTAASLRCHSGLRSHTHTTAHRAHRSYRIYRPEDCTAGLCRLPRRLTLRLSKHAPADTYSLHDEPPARHTVCPRPDPRRPLLAPARVRSILVKTSAGLTESVFNKALIHIHTPRAILCIACNEAGKLCRDGISNGTPRPNESGTSGKLHAWLHGGEV